jgi:hypothetical protein
MKSILIIGYGKWARKILYFVQKNNLFKNIYIKNKNQSYIFINNYLKKIKNLPPYQTIDLVHVCSPVATHYKYLKIFAGHKNLIIEKPFLKNLNQLRLAKKLLSNKKNPVVNYIDLYNPLMSMLQKKIKNKCSKIILEYSNTSSLFKKKYLCAEDWLEHPLSVILLLFKKFTKFHVLHKTFVNKKNKFFERIEIEYVIQQIKIIIRININNKSSRKIYVYNSKDLKFIFNLKINKIISKGKIITNKISDDSLHNLYKSMIIKKKIIIKSMLFYEKITKERISIMKNLRND